jgi:hypothetical protein
MRWAVDVGYITLIYTETVTVLLVRAQFILGSDAWLGGAYDHHIYTHTRIHTHSLSHTHTPCLVGR